MIKYDECLICGKKTRFYFISSIDHFWGYQQLIGLNFYLQKYLWSKIFDINLTPVCSNCFKYHMSDKLEEFLP